MVMWSYVTSEVWKMIVEDIELMTRVEMMEEILSLRMQILSLKLLNKLNHSNCVSTWDTTDEVDRMGGTYSAQEISDSESW